MALAVAGWRLTSFVVCLRLLVLVGPLFRQGGFAVAWSPVQVHTDSSVGLYSVVSLCTQCARPFGLPPTGPSTFGCLGRVASLSRAFGPGARACCLRAYAAWRCPVSATALRCLGCRWGARHCGSEVSLLVTAFPVCRLRDACRWFLSRPLWSFYRRVRVYS